MIKQSCLFSKVGCPGEQMDLTRYYGTKGLYAVQMPLISEQRRLPKNPTGTQYLVQAEIWPGKTTSLRFLFAGINHGPTPKYYESRTRHRTDSGPGIRQ